MKWLLLLWKFAWAVVLVAGIVTFAVFVSGCAALEQPKPPHYAADDYRRANDDTLVLCFRVQDGAHWWMRVPRRDCANWVPL